MLFMRRMVVSLDKNTLDNCIVIDKCIDIGIGIPNQYNGQCEGYVNEYEEPVEGCERCLLYELRKGQRYENMGND